MHPQGHWAPKQGAYPPQLGTVSQKGCVGVDPGLSPWPEDREGPRAPGHLLRALSKGG